jgi:16S rRNA (adenine1518-N6/adenine1519-N6)-dimethyltransferase
LGILTKELARMARRVIAVEVDSKLASAMTEVLSGIPNIEILNADILKVDLARMLTSTNERYKVVANLPYYITSPVLRRFLEGKQKPVHMVVMVQKEVGQAIVAHGGKMSLLAVEVQFYGRPTLVEYVPSGSFYPPPEVDSAILRIDPYLEPTVDVADVDGFFRVVRAGFSMPRKQLRNSLAHGLGIPPVEAAALLEEAGVNPRQRAETLGLEEWVRICEILAHYQL